MERMLAGLNKKGYFPSGFSTLEALIVVAILLILGAISLPGFMAWREDSNLNGALRQVQSDLMWARMEAVQRSCPVTVTFTNGQPAYTVWTDLNRNSTNDTGETVTHTVAQEFKNIQVGSSATLVFQPRGVVTSTGSVSLSNPRGTRVLNVNAAGRVSIQ
jgi:type IV fimbrial biogenesis protein FimT